MKSLSTFIGRVGIHLIQTCKDDLISGVIKWLVVVFFLFSIDTLRYLFISKYGKHKYHLYF